MAELPPRLIWGMAGTTMVALRPKYFYEKTIRPLLDHPLDHGTAAQDAYPFRLVARDPRGLRGKPYSFITEKEGIRQEAIGIEKMVICVTR